MNQQTPPMLGDRYQLQAVIGRGGMAEVWRARDVRLGREVAVKRLRVDLATDPTFQARFRREAQSAAGLNHPNIVSVYDTGEETDPASGVAVPYIVMELVQGVTLKDVLRDDRRILPERALEFTQGVLDALSYSHKAGIVHRDIKPANVMLTPTGTVKVMDFGIARAVADTSATMTQTAAVIGTAQYLSPEQARGETVDARSDIYSAGVLLYELLCGRPPFVGDSPVSVAYQHVREQPTPPSTLDPEITAPMDAVVMKALAKDPADRYQTAREMRDDISRILAGMPVAAPVPPAVAVAQPATAVTQVVTPAPAPLPVATPAADSGLTGATGATATGAVPVAAAENRRRTSPGTVVLILLLAALIGAVAYGIHTLNSPTPSTTTSPSATVSSASATPTPSATPTLVAVPQVSGSPSAAASSQLAKAGFVPSIVATNGASGGTVGNVVGQSPTGGTSAKPSSTVTITVNVGPKMVTIPSDLTGETYDTAKAELNKLGLNVTSATDDSSTEAAGTVTGSNPSGGTSVATGSTVTLSVAPGKGTVPNLSGMTLSEAQAYAKSQGFTSVVQSGTLTTSNATAGTIVQQNPGYGNTVSYSTTIKVVVAVSPSTPTVTASSGGSSSASSTPSS